MFSRIAKRLGRGKNASCVPDGHRYYVVGDIHGRIDLLRQLHAMILTDHDAAAPSISATVVFLGDYVDRGNDSKQVVEFLCQKPFDDFQHIFLLGNHEQAFIDFMGNPEVGGDWFRFGGIATALSYGAIELNEDPHPLQYGQIRDNLERNVPTHHLEFLQELNFSYEAGDYLFVHAGVYPGIPLEKQSRDDLIWIRDEFLKSRHDHGKIIVHGHSITQKPDNRKNRIGIDTGAYASNILTCLVLEGSSRRFLQTI